MKFYIFHKRNSSWIWIKLDEGSKQYLSREIYVKKPILQINIYDMVLWSLVLIVGWGSAQQ